MLRILLKVIYISPESKECFKWFEIYTYYWNYQIPKIMMYTVVVIKLHFKFKNGLTFYKYYCVKVKYDESAVTLNFISLIMDGKRPIRFWQVYKNIKIAHSQ